MAQESEWYLKKETESLILAAQEQALRTNSVKQSIGKTSETPRSRVCCESTETVWHIVSGCRKLVQKKYWKHHDKAGQGGSTGSPDAMQKVWVKV